MIYEYYNYTNYESSVNILLKYLYISWRTGRETGRDKGECCTGVISIPGIAWLSNYITTIEIIELLCSIDKYV